MKRSLILYLIAGAILTISIIKVITRHQKKQSVTTSNTTPVLPAEVFIADDTVTVFSFTTIGSLKAMESVEIVSEIREKIQSVHYREGEIAEKGELLFSLDDSDIVAELEKLRVEESFKSKETDRLKLLLKSGGISQQEFDKTETELGIIRASIGVLEVKLSKTKITAPFRGITGLRYVSPGELVSPEHILTTIQQTDKLRLEFMIPERYVLGINEGMEIAFRVPGIDKDFTAVIKAREPFIDTKTRSLKFLAVAQNSGQELIPGASASVSIEIPSGEKSIYLPTPCLIPTLKGYQVYVVRNGIATLQEIKTGLRSESAVQVLSGIEKGDTVVRTNLLRIKPGNRIQIAKIASI